MTQVVNRALAEDLANSLKALEGMTMEELINHEDEITKLLVSSSYLDMWGNHFIKKGLDDIYNKAYDLKCSIFIYTRDFLTIEESDAVELPF